MLRAFTEHGIFRNDARPLPPPTHMCWVHIVCQTLTRASSKWSRPQELLALCSQEGQGS